MAKIKKIIAREILDSRAFPTLEATIQLGDGSSGTFAVPSGLSVGKHEALELRDQDPKRYAGLGVLKCLETIHDNLGPKIIGLDAADQEEIDDLMIKLDGNHDKSKLGANTILVLSGAVMKAQAVSLKLPVYQYVAKLLGRDLTHFSMPTPMFNIINGGKHGGGNLDFQEFMIVPSRATNYSTGLRMGVEIYYMLKESLINHNSSILLGDEGGYAPILDSNLDAFKILEEAISKAGYKLGMDIFYALDAAANNILLGSSFKIKDRPVALTSSDFIDFYVQLHEQYHLISVEDPLPEDEWDDWQKLTEKMGAETMVVGDDLITTDTERLKKAIDHKSANALIIKPNQVGTITETLKVVKIAKEANFKIVASHRSGETNDDFIADFAVGIGADYCKFGAPARGERVAKYNRLLEIENELS